MPGRGPGTGRVRDPARTEASQPRTLACRPVAVLRRGPPIRFTTEAADGGPLTRGPPGPATAEPRGTAELLPGLGAPFRFTAEAADRGPQPRTQTHPGRPRAPIRFTAEAADRGPGTSPTPRPRQPGTPLRFTGEAADRGPGAEGRGGGAPCREAPLLQRGPTRGHSPPRGLATAGPPGPRKRNSSATGLGPPLLAGGPRGLATAGPRADHSRPRAGKSTRAQATTHAAAGRRRRTRRGGDQVEPSTLGGQAGDDEASRHLSPHGGGGPGPERGLDPPLRLATGPGRWQLTTPRARAEDRGSGAGHTPRPRQH